MGSVQPDIGCPQEQHGGNHGCRSGALVTAPAPLARHGNYYSALSGTLCGGRAMCGPVVPITMGDSFASPAVGRDCLLASASAIDLIRASHYM
eukprot:COSAG01_NODE_1801_length_9200_cov_13.641358_5_plen_93_part_00